MGGGMSLHGPIFTARRQILAELQAELLTTVAGAAERAVHTNLSASLRHPTGAYQGRVTTDRSMTDLHRVTDQGVIYGPWLEGTSSRNQTTRFKGYTSFRRAKQSVERDVEVIAAPIVAAAVGRLNR